MPIKIHKGQALSTINMTPVIDMVFLLLIFFLVASQFAEDERALKVVLPSASEAKPLTMAPKEVFVNVNERGEFFMDGRIMQIDEERRITRFVEKPKDPAVLDSLRLPRDWYEKLDVEGEDVDRVAGPVQPFAARPDDQAR